MVGVKLYRINPCPIKLQLVASQLQVYFELESNGTAPGGRLNGRGSPPPPPRGRAPGGGPWGLLWPPFLPGFLDFGGGWSPGDEKLSPSSPGGGALVVGTSQSSVGGVTHLLLFLSNTSMAGHLCRRGYPP